MPRWVGWLAAIAALIGAIGSAGLISWFPPLVGLTLVAVGVIAGALSKQILGSGIPHGIGWLGAALASLGALDVATIVPPGCVPSVETTCEAVRLLSLFPPKVAAAFVVIGVILKAFARAPGDSAPGGAP